MPVLSARGCGRVAAGWQGPYIEGPEFGDARVGIILVLTWLKHPNRGRRKQSASDRGGMKEVVRMRSSFISSEWLEPQNEKPDSA